MDTCPTCGATNSRQGGLDNVYIRHGRVYGLPERVQPVISHRQVMVPRYAYHNGELAVVKMVPKTYKVHGRGERTNVRIRLGKRQAKIIGGRRPWAICPDPFHGRRDNFWWSLPKIAPASESLSNRVHNPDLREKKQYLKRQLQGKDRR